MLAGALFSSNIDPASRAGLYQETVQAMLDGDFGTAKILLRDIVNATVGFARLGGRIDIPQKSLMRMFGPAGNPLVAILSPDMLHSGNPNHRAPP
jgi:hypothetical protein